MGGVSAFTSLQCPGGCPFPGDPKAFCTGRRSGVGSGSRSRSPELLRRRCGRHRRSLSASIVPIDSTSSSDLLMTPGTGRVYGPRGAQDTWSWGRFHALRVACQPAVQPLEHFHHRPGIARSSPVGKQLQGVPATSQCCPGQPCVCTSGIRLCPGTSPDPGDTRWVATAHENVH